MSRVIAALVLGALIGAVVFLFSRREPTAPASTRTAASSAPEAAPVAVASRAFVSATHPGLVVTVTRAKSPEPGARVELVRSARSLTSSELAWQPAGGETTDAEGRAAFPAVAGRYFVVAIARDGARAAQPVDVSRGGSPAVAVLALQAPLLFSGQVVDAASRTPLPQATIRADPQPAGDGTDDEALEATIAVAGTMTDSLGRFGLELPGQRWRLEARAAGYLSVAVGVELPSKDLVLALTRGVQISGVVVDLKGRPVADATLRITPGEVTSLSSDGEGRFSFTAPHEPVSLHALAPDGRQGLARLSLTGKQEQATVRLTVAEGTGLSGVVRDGQGPVSGADVRIIAEPESLEVASFQTGSDGRFAASGLPSGRYSVRAQQGTGRRASAVGLELPGAAPVELVLQGAGHLVGRVQGEAGQPMEGAIVTLEWQRDLNEVARTARSGPDGRFEFDDLLPAQVTLQARADELVSAQSATYVAPDVSAEVTLTIALQGRLVGTVSDPRVTKVLVRPEVGYGPGFTHVTLVGQRFEAMLAPGSYSLFAEVGVPGTKEFHFIQSLLAVVRSGEITTVVLLIPQEDGGGPPGALDLRMHPELGTGMSFENSPGGVRVDFLMSDCPAAKAGVRTGDLVVAIDGQSTRDARDAFARVRTPADGATTLELLVRRDGRDLQLTVR